MLDVISLTFCNTSKTVSDKASSVFVFCAVALPFNGCEQYYLPWDIYTFFLNCGLRAGWWGREVSLGYSLLLNAEPGMLWSKEWKRQTAQVYGSWRCWKHPARSAIAGRPNGRVASPALLQTQVSCSSRLASLNQRQFASKMLNPFFLSDTWSMLPAFPDTEILIPDFKCEQLFQIHSLESSCWYCILLMEN